MTQNDYTLPDNWEFNQHAPTLNRSWNYAYLARNYFEGLFPISNVMWYKLRTEAVKIKRIFITQKLPVPNWLMELTK